MGGDGTGDPGSREPADDEDSDPVMEMVREQLQRSSPPSTHALYGRAVYLDPSLRRLSLRQFHARYPLQVKREMARRRAGEASPGRSGADTDGGGRAPSEGGEEPESPAGSGGRRQRLRQVFLDFARAMSRPEAAAGGAFVAARKLPAYVERAVQALEGRA